MDFTRLVQLQDSWIFYYFLLHVSFRLYRCLSVEYSRRIISPEMQRAHFLLSKLLFALSVLFDLLQEAALKASVIGLVHLSILNTHHATHLHLITFNSEKFADLVQVVFRNLFELLWWASAWARFYYHYCSTGSKIEGSAMEIINVLLSARNRIDLPLHGHLHSSAGVNGRTYFLHRRYFVGGQIGFSIWQSIEARWIHQNHNILIRSWRKCSLVIPTLRLVAFSLLVAARWQ